MTDKTKQPSHKDISIDFPRSFFRDDAFLIVPRKDHSRKKVLRHALQGAIQPPSLLGRLFALAFFAAFWSNAQNNVQLTADPPTVEAGHEARIRWSAPAATEVYLSGLGLVKSKDVAELSFSRTSTIGLLFRMDDRYLLRTVVIEVSGLKGDPDFVLDPSAFKVASSIVKTRRSLVRAIDELRRKLPQLGFDVQEVPNLPSYGFFTAPRTMSNFKLPDGGVRACKVSYLVQVAQSEDSKSAQYTIRVRTQCERKSALGEWRNDEDGDRNHREIEYLKDLLAGQQAPAQTSPPG